MRIIETPADIAEGLDWLARTDPRLVPVITAAGSFAPRRREAGFPGLARIVIGQQVSTASAEAIWSRFAAAFPAIDADAIHDAEDKALRAPGLSRTKIMTMRAIAEASRAGLDLHGLGALPGDLAYAKLVAVKGIGPWTADLYLLFCLGHADIFPAGDLALRISIADAFDLDAAPSIPATAEIASDWSPWRGVAAHLFWAFYRARRARSGVPL